MSLVQVIPSYRPNDDKVWNKRKKYLVKRLTGFAENTNIKTIIYAQLWKDEDVEEIQSISKNIEIKRYNEPLAPKGGHVSDVREFILNEMYETDYDFFLMTDDEITILNNYGIYDLFNQIDTNPETIPFDIIMANPMMTFRYKPLNLAKKEVVERSFTFDNSLPIPRGCNDIIRNFKKYNRKPIYYHSSFVFEGKEYPKFDDVSFYQDSMIDGYFTVNCEQFIIYCSIDEALSVHDLGLREVIEKTRKNQTLYKQKRLEELGFKSWSAFRKYIDSKRPRYTSIKRVKPYTFTERELKYTGTLLENYASRVYTDVSPK